RRAARAAEAPVRGLCPLAGANARRRGRRAPMGLLAAPTRGRIAGAQPAYRPPAPAVANLPRRGRGVLHRRRNDGPAEGARPPSPGDALCRLVGGLSNTPASLQ